MKSKLKLAFTLIELLVVIAIVGILSGLIIVGMSSSVDSARIAKAQIFSNSLRDSLLMNLISEWKFDGSGVADGGLATTAYTQDTWNGGNNGIIAGSPTVASGSSCIRGSCLNFPATGDYIRTPASNNLNPGTGSFTVEGWVFAKDYTYPRTRFPVGNYTGSGSGVPCWATDDGYSSTSIWVDFYDGTNRVANGINCDVGYRPTDTQNKWTHTVVVFDRAAAKAYAYVNAVKQSGSVNISSVTGNVINGAGNNIGNAAGWQLYGLVDEFRMYSNIVPSSQIKEQYYIGLNSLLAGNDMTKEEYQNRLLGIR